ncbi:serine/threonine-protein kinase [Streptomyces sp. DH12]|uniref:serine/threonine-protein kinase n=1 Tax=Streptomyces sp. DH12 TaxID=2857010 RepID=UPI001E64909B|nr:serine/threonine-protein kinase [Streptomyces sp. DH12]
MSGAEQSRDAARDPQRSADGEGTTSKGATVKGDKAEEATAAKGAGAQGGAPAGDAPRGARPEGASPAGGTPGTTTPGGAAPDGEAPKGGAPRADTSEDGGPANGSAGSGASGSGASGSGASAGDGPGVAPGVAPGVDVAKKPAGGTAAAGTRATTASGDGRLLAGRYRLGGVLGRGGMGTVWRAVDETLGRTVAVKELRFPTSIDEDEKRRLITRTLREAKAIARIRNTSAVTVFDVVDEDDRPWIVMELIEGRSLADVIREDGTLTPRRAAEVGLAILDVLRSAHRQGILHRDVKPSNVLISDDGRVVLTDFGIAQVEGDPSITSTGMLVGAPSYISPERARGQRPGPAADMWSLGGLLYACVEGHPPYDKGSAIATLTAVMTEQLDPPHNAGPLDKVIYGLLAKDPAQRLDDAGARALLTEVLRLTAAQAAPSPEPSPEATRVVPLPPVPPPTAGDAATTPSGPAAPAPAGEAAADRLRGALRSVRNAASATAAKQHRPAKPERSTPPAPVRASLTDVVPRRTLVTIAVVAVLAVVATVLALSLGKDGDSGAQGKGGDTAATAGTTAGGADGAATGGGAGNDGRPDGGQGTEQGSGKPDPGASGTAGADAGTGTSPGTGATSGTGAKPSGGPGAGAALPAGYKTVTDSRFRFSMAMPENFRMTGVAGRGSGGIYSASGGFPRVQVDYTGSPGGDAAAAWTAAMGAVAASSNGYRHHGIKSVSYNGYPTVADWQFERNQGGARVWVLNRGFKVDATHGYAIMITCKSAEWNEPACTTLRNTAFATFRPTD